MLYPEPQPALPVVIIESPYLGGVHWAVQYAKLCMLDALRAGKAPLASHLLYPGLLDDRVEADRNLGMRAGWSCYNKMAQQCRVYTDLGITKGMKLGMEHAKLHNVQINYYSFGATVRDMIICQDMDPRDVFAAVPEPAKYSVEF